MKSNYQAAVKRIDKEIREGEITLNCQLKYYEYVRNNVAKMVGKIDLQIEQLKKEREKVVTDFTIAPKRIAEIKLFIIGLVAKRNKMLVTPKIKKVMELKAKLRALGVDV